MRDEPSGYDREFTAIVDRRSQIRTGLSTERGRVTRFFVQLEYWLDGEWREVVRFDHDPSSPFGHDVASEGIHMDVYRNGRKYHVKRDFPAVELNRAPRYCTAYIRENTDSLLRRFERWHNVNDPIH